MEKYSLSVLIGRFQPLHNSHLDLVQTALLKSDKVLVFIGSSNTPRTYKNPFSFQERANMIHYALPISDRKRVTYIPLEDTMYNDQAWVSKIQQEVAKLCDDDTKISLVGHIKDESSYYIKMFPQWKFIDAGYKDILHATEIRDMYFKNDFNINYLVGVIPNNVQVFLEEFRKLEAFKEIIEERMFMDNYRKQFDNYPYPPIFVTVDAVVIQSGHVLLIKRKAYPGKGLLALPGGFLNAKTDKSIESAMIRELVEETGIKLPEKVLLGNIKNKRVFDAIDRSSRGRTITHAYKISLLEGEWNLPKIKGGDDAESAEWKPIGTLKREDFFEDHYDILLWALGK